MKIKVKKDGTCTLSGITVPMLRAILTGSQFYREGRDNPMIDDHNDQPAKNYNADNLRIVNELQKALDKAIKDRNEKG